MSKKIFVILLGESPEILTMTLWSLKNRANWTPDEIVVITSGKGVVAYDKKKEDIQDAMKEMGLNGIKMIGEKEALLNTNDIVFSDHTQNFEHSLNFIDKIATKIRKLKCEDKGCEIVLSITAGPRHLAYWAGTALGVFGGTEDRVAHIIVPDDWIKNNIFIPIEGHESLLSSILNPNLKITGVPDQIEKGKSPFSLLFITNLDVQISKDNPINISINTEHSTAEIKVKRSKDKYLSYSVDLKKITTNKQGKLRKENISNKFIQYLEINIFSLKFNELQFDIDVLHSNIGMTIDKLNTTRNIEIYTDILENLKKSLKQLKENQSNATLFSFIKSGIIIEGRTIPSLTNNIDSDQVNRKEIKKIVDLLTNIEAKRKLIYENFKDIIENKKSETIRLLSLSDKISPIKTSLENAIPVSSPLFKYMQKEKNAYWIFSTEHVIYNIFPE